MAEHYPALRAIIVYTYNTCSKKHKNSIKTLLAPRINDHAGHV